MPKKRTIESIETEISKVQSAIDKNQIRHQELLDKLRSLEEQKKIREVEIILQAYKKSKKSLNEVMIFLQP